MFITSNIKYRLYSSNHVSVVILDFYIFILAPMNFKLIAKFGIILSDTCSLFIMMWQESFPYPLIILKSAAGILKLSCKLALQIGGILQVHLQILHFLSQLNIFL